MESIGANVDMIGTLDIARRVDNWSKADFKDFTKKAEIDEETISLIIKGLKQPLGYDLRSDIEQPAFNRKLSSINDLVVGQSVSGVVSNVTPFGVFVDFGVERNGLIHQSKLGSASNLGPGDKCDCSVISIDKERMRIGLKFDHLRSAMPVLQ